MTTPRLGIGEHAESQTNGEVVANSAYRRIESLFNARIIDRDLSTPPGSPSNGDTYLVAGTGTGAWVSHDGEIAFYQDGWLFADPEGGMTAFVVDEKIWIGYSSVESEWHPLSPIWSTTEHWTGQYRDSKKVYSKVLNINSLLPDIATDPQNHAHGITGLDFNETITFEGSLQIPGSSFSAPIPFINSSGGAVEVNIDATNVIFNVNFDAGTTFGMRVEWVRLTYCKT